MTQKQTFENRLPSLPVQKVEEGGFVITLAPVGAWHDMGYTLLYEDGVQSQPRELMAFEPYFVVKEAADFLVQAAASVDTFYAFARRLRTDGIFAIRHARQAGIQFTGTRGM